MNSPYIHFFAKNRLPSYLEEKLSSHHVKRLSHKPEYIEDFMLYYHEGKLRLYCPGEYRFKPVELDFNQNRLTKGRDPLLRAIGAAKQVVDLTAGWCEDAMHLVRHGIKVQAVEKNLVVYLMIKHAEQQLTDSRQGNLLSVYHAEGEQWLSAYREPVEVIFLDPMYPLKPKQAISRKAMQVLQKLVCHQPNPERLLETSLQTATKRVVVKRPHYAKPLKSGKVGEISGKLVRFDIYKSYRGSVYAE